MKIPWKSLAKDPIIVDIRDVFVIVSPFFGKFGNMIIIIIIILVIVVKIASMMSQEKLEKEKVKKKNK